MQFIGQVFEADCLATWILAGGDPVIAVAFYIDLAIRTVKFEMIQRRFLLFVNSFIYYNFYYAFHF